MLQQLTNLLSSRQVLFVGVGNVLKSDDGIGVYICQEINKNPNVNGLVVESSIEKYIGKINGLKPEVLVLIDCMYFPGEKAGFFGFSSIKELTHYAMHTHNISLGNIADFFPIPVYILGIHPKNTDFGEHISDPLKKVADQIIGFINKAAYHNS